MATTEFDGTSAATEPASSQKVSVGRQVLRRELNDRISARNGRHGLEVFCECGRAGCRDAVSARAGRYESLRRVPTHFLIGAATRSPASASSRPSATSWSSRSSARAGSRRSSSSGRSTVAVREHVVHAHLTIELPDAEARRRAPASLQSFDVDTVEVDAALGAAHPAAASKIPRARSRTCCTRSTRGCATCRASSSSRSTSTEARTPCTLRPSAKAAARAEPADGQSTAPAASTSPAGPGRAMSGPVQPRSQK